MTTTIQNRVRDFAADEKMLNDLVVHILKKFNHGRGALGIRFVSEAEIRRLNRDYRKKDEATDVLAFSYDIPSAVEPSIGDVVICPKIVAEAAKSAGKNFAHHLMHIAAHGVLHLLGFEHEDGKNRQIMQNAEIEILAEFEIENPYV